MSYELEVLNRIDVQNDPVNFIDPKGLTAGTLVEPLLVTPVPGARIVAGGIIAGSAIYSGYKAWQYLNEKKKQNEKRPNNCPSGTKDIDKVKGKYGWSKDQLHNIKKGAHGGTGTGKSWTGVDPDGNVGINEGGEWESQGNWEDLL